MIEMSSDSIKELYEICNDFERAFCDLRNCIEMLGDFFEKCDKDNNHPESVKKPWPYADFLNWARQDKSLCYSEWQRIKEIAEEKIKENSNG